MNRFKRLDLVDRVPEELWMEVCNIAQETVTETKDIPKKKKCKQTKWLSEQTLQILIPEERTEAKGKGERKTIYNWMQSSKD